MYVYELLRARCPAFRRTAPGLHGATHCNRSPTTLQQTKPEAGPCGKRDTSSIAGVTLLEVLVGLSILLTIIVPLTTALARSGDTVSSRDKLTAICLLEQQTLRARLFPADRSGPSRRRIAGVEWVVRRSVSGDALRTVTVTVERDGRSFGSATFYVHEPAGAR